MAEKYQPVDHSALSKVGHTAGHAAGSGFRWGLAGFLLGATLLIGGPIVAGYAFGAAATAGAAAGFSWLAAGIGGVVSLFAAGPVLLGSSGIGAVLGAWGGAKSGAQKVERERGAHSYQQAYDMQMAKMHGAFEAQMQQAAQERMAYQQMALEHLREAYGQEPGYEQVAGLPEAAPRPEVKKDTDAAMAAMDSEKDVPASVIAANSAQHDSKLEQELAMAKA